MGRPLVQFGMCGSHGKYRPFQVVESVDRQRLLLLINAMPLEVEQIAERLNAGRKEVAESLRTLNRYGLVREVNGKHFLSFALFTNRDQKLLRILLKELSLDVKESVEKRIGDVRRLIKGLSCTKKGLQFPDLEYIVIGAMTLDYRALEVLRSERLLLSGKKMPGGGNYVFSGLEAGLVDLKQSWMWGHTSGFGKYWFSTHGRLPAKGRRMAFPDLTLQWAKNVEAKKIKHKMEQFGEMLELLSEDGLSIKDLQMKMRKAKQDLLTELTLLWTLEYVIPKDKKWKINRPFLTRSDLDRIRGLSTSVLKDIAELFKVRKPRLLELYNQTRPSKNKIPFEESFNILYHLIFERALDLLIEAKVISSPPARKDGGRYSPFVGVGIEDLLSI